MPSELGEYRSIHSKAVQRLFSAPAFSGTGPVFEKPLYLLGFTNRSGSNFLAEHLSNTGLFYPFWELLNEESLVKQQEKHGFSGFPDYIAHLYETIAPKKRQFGLKASATQIAMLHHFGILSMFPETRIFHIYRNDVVEQAVSFSIAFQTKQWTSRQTVQDTEVAYDFKDIHNRMRAVLKENQRIIEITSLLNLPILGLQYEAMTENPRAHIRRLLQFAGLDPKSAKFRKPELRKQATDQNVEFYRRFRRDFAASQNLRPPREPD